MKFTEVFQKLNSDNLFEGSDELTKLYAQRKELDAKIKALEAEEATISSNARKSALVFKGTQNEHVVLMAANGKLVRGAPFRHTGGTTGYEAFSAPEGKESDDDTMQYNPAPETRKAGKTEPLFISKGTPLKKKFNTLNDFRLWWGNSNYNFTPADKKTNRVKT